MSSKLIDDLIRWVESNETRAFNAVRCVGGQHGIELEDGTIVPGELPCSKCGAAL